MKLYTVITNTYMRDDEGTFMEVIEALLGTFSTRERAVNVANASVKEYGCDELEFGESFPHTETAWMDLDINHRYCEDFDDAKFVIEFSIREHELDQELEIGD